MTAVVGGVPVHFVEHGSGTPVLALHGAGVDHREIAGGLEPMFGSIPGFRRLYPDLPGMGRTPAHASLNSNDDVLDLLLGFIDSTIGDEPFLIIGQSYGGYLARAVAHLRPQAAGLALICPVGAHTGGVPKHEVLVSAVHPAGLDGESEASFHGYFVVQTDETLERFLQFVAPAAALVDGPGLARIFSRWELRDRPESAALYPRPVLVLVGRQDATAGYADGLALAQGYPRGTFAVLDRALLHEQPVLVQAFLAEWISRVREDQAPVRDGSRLP
jgi:pimeloyl-ACP methyl ester carboxylesterase